MPGSLEADVIGSISLAANHSKALDDGLRRLRIAVADRAWDKIEPLRAEMLAAVDGYVDHYVAAAKRVEHERDYPDAR